MSAVSTATVDATAVEAADVEAAVAALEGDGYALLAGVLPASLADEGLAYLRRVRALASRLVKAGKLDELYAYGNVKCRRRRCDLHLSLGDPTVRRLIRALLDKVYPVLVATMGTDEVTLVELSSLHALPSAASQPPHADTDQRCGRCVVTCFAALHAVDASMGPTVVWPGSHLRPERSTPESVVVRAEAQAKAEAEAKATGAGSWPPPPPPSMSIDSVSGWRGGTPALLAAGGCLLMDSRLVHCGSANVSASVGEGALQGAAKEVAKERRGGAGSRLDRGKSAVDGDATPPSPACPHSGVFAAPAPPVTARCRPVAGGCPDGGGDEADGGDCGGGGDGGGDDGDGGDCGDDGVWAGAGSDRVLVYCSWQLPGATCDGSTYSLLPEYGRRFKLRDYKAWTQSDGGGGGDCGVGGGGGGDSSSDGGGGVGVGLVSPGVSAGGGPARCVPATAWDQAVALDREDRGAAVAAAEAAVAGAALPPKKTVCQAGSSCG